jgi:hypothetical protein
MRGLVSLSIALSPIFLPALLPRDAIGASYTEHAEVVWSSRDGLLQSRHSATPDPAVETGGAPLSPTADTRPSVSQDTLICEPYR